MDYMLGLYEKSMPNHLSLEEKLQAAKRTGFDHVEISVDETDEKLSRLSWSAQERMDLLKVMDRTGLRFRSMCLSGHRKYPFGSRDAQIRARGLEIMKDAVQLAEDLGIRIIQLAGYDVYYEESGDDTEKLFRENLACAVEMASQKGIMLGFETMETPFMDTVGKAMHYVDLIQSPFLGVYPDIGNLTNASKIYGHTVNEDLELGRGHVVATHLKETKPGHYREIPFGTGHTQYEEQLALLKDMGVTMLAGEFWYVGAEDWEKDLVFANNFLRERIDRVYR